MRNPKEFFWVNGVKTLAVMNELARPDCADGSEPLSMYHGTFSLFKFCLFDKTGENGKYRALEANIPIALVPAIFAAVDRRLLALQVSSMVAPPAAAVDDGGVPAGSAAFSVVIRSGRLKGLTPAGALLADAQANKPLLENQVVWLQSNLAKYPKNKEQIDAIREALNLYAAGKLEGSGIKPLPQKTVVYPGGLRPLTRRRRPNGKCLVYTISIALYDKGERPIEITIRNMYAPVRQTDKGLLNVIPKDKVTGQILAEDIVASSISLTISEWEWFRHLAEAQMRTFENIWAPSLYRCAANAERENRLAAGLRDDPSRTEIIPMPRNNAANGAGVNGYAPARTGGAV